MKKIQFFVLLLTILIFLPACHSVGPAELLPGITESSYEGLSLQILSANREDGKTILEVQWTNDTEYEILYGESFSILRKDGDQWRSCDMKENTAFNAIGYGLNAGSKTVKSYQIDWIYDVSKPGIYRFATECYVYDTQEGTKCQLWAEFSIEAPAAGKEGTAPFEASYVRTDGYQEGARYPQVVLIPSLAALERYYEENKGIYSLERRESYGSDYTEGFLDVCDSYDEAFFENNFLLMVLIGEGSGSIRHEVTQVYMEEGVLSVHISALVPEVGTCDMALWHVLIELGKSCLPQKEEDVQIWLDESLAYGAEEPYISWSKGKNKEPPQLRLVFDSGVAAASLGMYSWMYAQGDGTWTGVCADSLHPLQCKDLLDLIQTGSSTLNLDFQDQPDSCTVRCWPDFQWDNTQAEWEDISVRDFSIGLKKGGYIYEVIAEWEDDGAGCYGSAHYYFYASPASLHSHSFAMENGEEAEPSGYCGNTQTTVHLAGESFTFEGTNSVLLTDILRNLNYEEGKLCRCMAEFKVDTEFGSGYQVDPKKGFARFGNAQAELTEEQAKRIQQIMDWVFEQTKAR